MGLHSFQETITHCFAAVKASAVIGVVALLASTNPNMDGEAETMWNTRDSDFQAHVTSSNQVHIKICSGGIMHMAFQESPLNKEF